MKLYTIATDEITAVVSSMGAELISVKKNDDSREYMWDGDPQYWKRHSPVLFPLVGRYNNDICRFAGKEYEMTQHGFARDTEFELLIQKDDEIWFAIESDESTRSKYPFEFRLECGYKAIGRSIEVMWKVINKDEKKMYFSIGAHPAFAPPSEKADLTKCYLKFDSEKNHIMYSLLSKDGLVLNEKYRLALTDGCVAVKSDMFDKDAFIIEDDQISEVSILDDKKRPFVTVRSDAPLFGIWSPVRSNVPFICIEPWFGRSDPDGFTGDLSEREWSNELEPGMIFNTKYTITFQ